MNTILKLDEQLIIDTVQCSCTKTEVFEKLQCYRNKKNIQELNKIIQKYNLQLNYNTNSKKHEKCNEFTQCQYCGNEYKLTGICYHEKYCKLNPNKKICYGNKGTTKGYKIWNKGLNKNVSESIKKQVQSIKKYYSTHTNACKGTKLSDEHKAKIRKSTIEYLKNTNSNFVGPRYNKNACKYIDMLNKQNNWHLQHAENGGEICIDGYYLDGYDKDLNIVFEYDESRHYKDINNNILIDNDINRQNYIIKKLGCRFFRYNETTNNLYEVFLT